MNKARKVELLYRKAKGQSMNATKDELLELRKYNVSQYEDKFYTTKANISAYVSSVDQGGLHTSFYDWCMNHERADRRRKNSSAADIARANRADSYNAIILGWLTWGLALYWMAGGSQSVGSCAVLGAIISVILGKIARRWAGIILFLLPLILAVVFGS